ncbi:peptidase M24, structural domain-containing protein [Cokeromyces recurvatus]|uniref:peptidase M24, structural domain-containing protein n=1 Tax=Cokeromyces recurvatus TaxID=90255 RepID=UPI00221E8A22|nr:peptidase M24, structural domain-containing protein [Cokeromyces recurvatus]KAI7907476.1 peptidase M24, structural domain-containing protein [Cokeromyces recurvatus]
MNRCKYSNRLLFFQKKQFHSYSIQSNPRRSLSVKNIQRWGNYERLVPASLAKINVRDMPHRSVPEHIMRPPYAEHGTTSSWAPKIVIQKDEEYRLGMRRAGQLAKRILSMSSSLCQPGITTNEIDRAVHQAIIEQDAYPSPLNYNGFPKSVCTSINNIIAHGIPDDRPLKDGDIINVDVTVYLNGYHGDTSATFLVGNVDEKGKALVECTKECLDKAISICGPNVPYKEIGRVICEHATKFGYSVSDELSGHGIGSEFHCLPLIYHHLNEEEGVMESGTTFTIEPILCQGSAIGIMWPDQWTISTVDGSRSAQFEHTLYIHDDGVEILTD